jgi:hypothetical protein
MKKWQTAGMADSFAKKSLGNRGVFLVFLLLLVLLHVFHASGNAADNPLPSAKQSAKIKFQAKYPNGLYLYKPKEEKNEFSPLFIVKDGRLFDPYLMAEKNGEDQFFNDYVKGKTFHVSIYSENVGEISDLRLQFRKPIQTKEFVADIKSNGTYLGKPLQVNQYIKSSFLLEKDFKKFAIPKFIATPLLNREIKKGELSLTEEDKKKASDAVRKQLLPEATRYVNERLQLEKEKSVIVGDNSSISFAWAIDLEQDGKKVIIGCYSITIEYQKQERDVRHEHDRRSGWALEILFALREDGKVEQISFDTMSPAFSFIDAIDLNGDGAKEIIMEIGRSPEDEPFFGGKSIAIFSSSAFGWKQVFQSAKTANSICY